MIRGNCEPMKGGALELPHAEKPNPGELLIEMRKITKGEPADIETSEKENCPFSHCYRDTT